MHPKDSHEQQASKTFTSCNLILEQEAAAMDETALRSG